LTIGALRVELHVPGASSLKAKRQVIKSLKDRLRNRFNVSVAEVDQQDKWQRATLGIAMAGTDGKYVAGALDEVMKFLRGQPAVAVCHHEVEVF
jgi:uncharacterized protein YlxP (DUF503 family)